MLATSFSAVQTDPWHHAPPLKRAGAPLPAAAAIAAAAAVAAAAIAAADAIALVQRFPAPASACEPVTGGTSFRIDQGARPPSVDLLARRPPPRRPCVRKPPQGSLPRPPSSSRAGWPMSGCVRVVGDTANEISISARWQLKNARGLAKPGKEENLNQLSRAHKCPFSRFSPGPQPQCGCRGEPALTRSPPRTLPTWNGPRR